MSVFNRWLIFGLFIAGSSAVLLGQPPQSAFLLFVSIGLLAVVVPVIDAGRLRPALMTAGNLPGVSPEGAGGGSQSFLDGLRGFIGGIRWQPLLGVLGGLTLMYLGQAYVYQDNNSIPLSGGWIMYLLGTGMFFMALNDTFPPVSGMFVEPAPAELPAPIPAPEPAPEAEAAPKLSRKAQRRARAAAATAGPAAKAARTAVDYVARIEVRWRWLGISVALAALVAWRSILKPQEAHLAEHIIIWMLSMLCMVIAFAPPEGKPRVPDAHPIRGREWLLIAALLLVAGLIRCTNLNNNPDVLDQDEAIFAREGASFISENFLITPFEPGYHSHPRIYQAMIGVSDAIFGFTKEGARMPSAIMGALGVVALYLLGRELFGWQIGLTAALFMLPWFFHVQLARLSMNQPGDPLFATLAFFFLVRGIRRRAPTDYVLSGINLGCAQLFYLGGRLAIPIMIAYIVFVWLIDRPLIARQWRYLGLVALAAFVVTMPQNHYLFYYQQPLSTRAEPNILLGGQLQNMIDNGEDVVAYLVSQVRYSFLALLQFQDQSGWIGRGSNMIGLYGGPLLLIGAIASLALIWKRPRWSLPLGWAFSVILIGSTLSISPPQYQRYYPAVSAFSLLVALGAATVANGVCNYIGRPRLYLRMTLGIGVLLFALNAYFYYGVYTVKPTFLQNRPNWATNATAAEMVAASDAGRQIVLIGSYATGVEHTLVVQYFMMGRKYYIFDDGLGDFSGTGSFTMIIAPERQQELDEMPVRYPGGRLRPVYLPQDGSLAFYVYERG